MSIRADRIVVRQDKEGNQYATATGNPVRFKQRQDPKPPEKEGVWMEGEAKRIELDDKSQKVELFEAARVNRGGDEVDRRLHPRRPEERFLHRDAGQGTKAAVRATIQPKPPAK